MNSEARVLERPRGVPAQDHNEIGKRNRSAYSGKASAITAGTGTQDWGARQVREWLLLLLRFAITSDPGDRSAALALADEIDALSLQWRPAAPTFFRRTTSEVCKAIIALDDPKRIAVLKRHIARIDDPALKRAFQAAVNMEERSLESVKERRRGLWSGLRR
jgi:hypothetical protein